MDNRNIQLTGYMVVSGGTAANEMTITGLISRDEAMICLAELPESVQLSAVLLSVPVRFDIDLLAAEVNRTLQKAVEANSDLIEELQDIAQAIPQKESPRWQP